MPRAQVVIENPILKTPYDAPTRHFRFDDEGITDEIVAGRRVSSYFMPIPKAKKRGGQLAFDEWTGDRIEENRLINQIRERVDCWRELHWPGVTPTTRALLEHWTNPERERRLFFCQIEALETAIYLTEAARGLGDAWIENQLRMFAEDANPGLFRVAHKMATGTGKTVVMAMLIAWHTLNEAVNPQDRRFSDAFLLVAPGITIRDRLRVLLPSDPDNYYRLRDIVPPDRAGDLGRAKIVITNFHAFQPPEKVKAPKLTKELAGQRPGVFTETPHEVARRVTRELGTKRNIDDQRRGPPLLPGGESATTSARPPSGTKKRGSGSRDCKPSPPRPGSGSSTTCRPRRSTCEAPAGPRGRCSSGSSRTSPSSTPSRPAWSRSPACRSTTTRRRASTCPPTAGSGFASGTTCRRRAARPTRSTATT